MTTTSAPSAPSEFIRSPLSRPRTGRLVAGVAGAIADYLAVDVTAVRIAFVVLALVGGVGIPLYVAGWLLIPEVGAERPLAADLLDRLPRYSPERW
jgi:phage shock protein PspC (stress-responsive transcriptional regulator)